MTLEEAIELYENDYLETDLQTMQPKDRLSWYTNAKEFQRAKMQRTSINPNDQKLPDDIYTDPSL